MTAAAQPGVAMGRLGLLLRIVLPFGTGYFLSYFLRNVNAVIGPQIVEEFALEASQIGLMTSLYFFAAMLALVPVAVGLDRFGPRRMLMAELCVTLIGALVFSLGQSAGALMLGRLLIGLGVAGCLMTALKAVTIWFPRDRWATGNAFMLAVGSLGVILGTQPLEWALGFIGWRDVFWAAAGLCACVLVVLIFLVPERNAPPAAAPIGSLALYGRILRLGVFWRLMPIASGSMGTFFAIQGLWASAWMRDVAQLAPDAIAARLLAMALAMSAGMLAQGWIGDALARRGVPYAAPMSVGLVILLGSQAAVAGGWAPEAWWPWIAMGFTGSIGVLGYPILSRRFPGWASARAMSLITMSNFVIAFLVQLGLGIALDLWGAMPDGRYPEAAYAAALWTIIGLQALALLSLVTSRAIWGPIPPPDSF